MNKEENEKTHKLVDYHFSTLFDTPYEMEMFFRHLMYEMNCATSNGSFQIAKVDGKPLSFTALPDPKRFRFNVKDGPPRKRPASAMVRIPDPVTFTVRFEKFIEPEKQASGLIEAAKTLIQNSFWQYKAGNGKMMSIEDEHGEKCMIVKSEDLDRLNDILVPKP